MLSFLEILPKSKQIKEKNVWVMVEQKYYGYILLNVYVINYKQIKNISSDKEFLIRRKRTKICSPTFSHTLFK